MTLGSKLRVFKFKVRNQEINLNEGFCFYFYLNLTWSGQRIIWLANKDRKNVIHWMRRRESFYLNNSPIEIILIYCLIDWEVVLRLFERKNLSDSLAFLRIRKEIRNREINSRVEFQ